MPTTAEWACLTKYSRRMRELELDLDNESVASNVLSVLQLRTLNEPLLPNLKSLVLKEVPADVIPLIPLFLSPRTTDIEIRFDPDSPTVMVASMMINLPKLCPYAQSITLEPLPRDSTITNAASEMLLACNPDTLHFFQVDSPLTEEATRVVFQLQELLGLWVVFTESTSLPKMSLPNLTALTIEYHRDHDWLQGFHGMTFSKLTEVIFQAECQQVGAFLEAFEEFALVTSVSAVLSSFQFYTPCSWNPSYHSLLTFKQLKELVLEFSCDNGCSSRTDDEALIALAEAMPMLEVLRLGDAPCQVPGNVTIRGLIALARGCPDLSTLRVHFQPNSMIEELADETAQSPQKSYLPREGCALTCLEVGAIHMSIQHRLPVFLTLLRIFPRLRNIEYIDEGWKWVADTIKLSNQIDSFVHHSGKVHRPYLMIYGDIPTASTLDNSPETESAGGTH